MESVLAGLIAALLTFFDLDSAFYVPAQTQGKVRLYCWWWGFVLVNGLLAIILYFVASGVDGLKDLNPWAKAAAVGFGYLALIRAKVATIPVAGSKEGFPVGPEILYNSIKDYVYRQIDTIARVARIAETEAKIKQRKLPQLKQDALNMVEHAAPAVIKPDQKRAIVSWIEQVANDTQLSDDDRRRKLAIYILTGRQPY